MKKICLFLFFTILGVSNVSGATVDTINTICDNEYLQPYITIVSTIINGIKIAVPIILIILGMIDMVKAVASQKEDEIKKGQKNLINRCITGAIVFFVVAIVQLIMNIIATSSDDSSVMNCVCKFVGSCNE